MIDQSPILWSRVGYTDAGDPCPALSVLFLFSLPRSVDHTGVRPHLSTQWSHLYCESSWCPCCGTTTATSVRGWRCARACMLDADAAVLMQSSTLSPTRRL